MAGVFGFRIGPDFERPEAERMAQLRSYSTTLLADGLKSFNVVDAAIRSISDDFRFAGPALTVRVRPGDNLMVHHAISMIRPGDVLVIDTCGCTSHAVLGDLMASSAFKEWRHEKHNSMRLYARRNQQSLFFPERRSARGAGKARRGPAPHLRKKRFPTSMRRKREKRSLRKRRVPAEGNLIPAILWRTVIHV